MKKGNKYIKVDSVFIGAGPSNLIAANYLAEHDYDDFLILEKGDGYLKRSGAQKNNKRYSVIFGVGGAGLFSDGKFNFSPIVGGNPLDLISKDNYEYLVNKIEKLLKLRRTVKISKKIEEFNKKYCKKNINFLEIEQAHIGTNKLPNVIKELTKRYVDRIITNVEVSDINYNKGFYFIYTNGGNTYKCRNLIVSVGQKGSDFSKKIATKFGVQVEDKMVDIGVRLETRKETLEPITNIQYDPKIYFNYTDCSVRTFCTNPGGDVIVEKKEDYVTVNGHANSDNENEFSNTALMCRLENIHNPRLYSENLCKKISKVTKNKIAVQYISEILGKRSGIEIPVRIKHQFVKMEKVYGPELSVPLINTLRRLDEILSGNLDGVIYFPEMKLYNSIVDVEKNTFKCKGKTPNLFMLGDCVGTIHGLTNACLAGLSFAKYFIRQHKHG